MPKETVKERKLFETTQYLITIVNRILNIGPFGLEKELYFISEDVKNALKNIGTKQARFFVKQIEEAKLMNELEFVSKWSRTHKIKKIFNDGTPDFGKVDLTKLQPNQSVCAGDGETFYYLLTEKF